MEATEVKEWADIAVKQKLLNLEIKRGKGLLVLWKKRGREGWKTKGWTEYRNGLCEYSVRTLEVITDLFLFISLF